MILSRPALFLGLAVLLASCSKETPGPSRNSGEPVLRPSIDRTVVLKVDGMQRGAGGKTWMAWPEAVERALAGLEGVAKVEVDLERDLFRVTLERQKPPMTEILVEAIRKLSYTATPVDASSFRPMRDPLGALGKPPDRILKALECAKAERKRFVLVDCMGDSWPACKKMSVQTWSDPQVRRILREHFVFVELNVDREKESAGWFAGNAIPDAWVLGPDGRMLDRVVGFMGPQDFAARLRKVVEGE